MMWAERAVTCGVLCQWLCQPTHNETLRSEWAVQWAQVWHSVQCGSTQVYPAQTVSDWLEMRHKDLLHALFVSCFLLCVASQCFGVQLKRKQFALMRGGVLSLYPVKLTIVHIPFRVGFTAAKPLTF